MLPIATADNPTAIPPTEPRRQRERDELSWSGVRVVWTLADQDAYRELLEDLCQHPNPTSRVSANLERLLRALLTRQEGENPDYCPAVPHLARDCRLNESTIRRLLNKAVELGILEKRERHREPTSKRAGKRQTQTSNRYLLLLPALDEIGEFSVGCRREVEPEVEIVPAELSTGVADRHPTTDSFYLMPSSLRGVDAGLVAIRADRVRRMSGLGGSGGITLRAGQPASPFGDGADFDPIDRVPALLALKAGYQSVGLAGISDVHSHHTGLRRQGEEACLASSHGLPPGTFSGAKCVIALDENSAFAMIHQ